jgi:hypothetical protein
VDQRGLLKVEDGWSGATVWSAPGARAGAAPAMLCIRTTGALLLLGKQGEAMPAAMRSPSTTSVLCSPQQPLPVPLGSVKFWFVHACTLQAQTCSGSPATIYQAHRLARTQCA